MPKNDQRPKKRKAGLTPGSLVFTGSRKVDQIDIHHLRYNFELHEEKVLDTKSLKLEFSPAGSIIDWYDIRGLHDVELIKYLGEVFSIHPLILEDITDIHQRPKFEDYESGVFIITKALAFDRTDLLLKSEQVSIYFKDNLVISFQEDKTDLFEVIRQRLASGRGQVRKRGADYLAYALTDYLVDRYYLNLDDIAEAIQLVEDEILAEPRSEIKAKIHNLKKQLLTARKVMVPSRDAIYQLSKTDSKFVEEKNDPFLRDVYDHIVQVVERVDNQRDLLNGLQDLYLSEISFKMNQVMQTLTIITVIFVPLSFLAGLYGMNFDHMPELHFRYSYFVLLGVMFFIFLSAIWYFRTRRWF